MLILAAWHFRPASRATGPSGLTGSSPATPSNPSGPETVSDSNPTNVYAHNLMLRKGPNFQIYIRWLRGQMIRTRPEVNPSFDDPESFFLNVKNGVIRANIGDISNFLNANGVANSPLKNITLSGYG